MERHFYHKLCAWQQTKSRKPLVLLGVRQCGKTYLLKHFGAKQFPKVHYINFEKNIPVRQIFATDLDPRRIIQEINFHLDASIDIAHDLLIFDEIQECPAALTSLKYFSEDMPQLALCSAGSLLGIHLNPGSFPVGKVDIMDLQTMTFTEFLLALDDQKALRYLESCTTTTTTAEIIHAYLLERLKWYFIVGGLPEAVSTFVEHKTDLYLALQLVRAKQEILIKTYYADITKHSGKVNAMHIDRVWRSIPSQLARSQDGYSNKFQFKGIIPNIDRYGRLASTIDWLLTAGLITKVPIVSNAQLPLSAYTKESVFKLYMFDVGILGAMSELAPKTIMDHSYGTYKGYFVENFIAQELLANNFSLYSWHDNRAEIEFLTTIEENIIPIEVKSGNITKTKSLEKYVAKYQPKFQVIMSTRYLSINSNGNNYYPLYLAHRLPIS